MCAWRHNCGGSNARDVRLSPTGGAIVTMFVCLLI